MKLFFILVCFLVAIAVSTSGSAVIDSRLQKRFIGGIGGGNTQNVMISFTQGIQTIIQQISRQNFSSISGRRTALTNAQQAFTETAQMPLKRFLNTMGVKYESFWINNRMVIPNVNSRLVQAMSNIPGVAKIEEEPVVNIQLPVVDGQVEEEEEESGNFSRNVRQSRSLAWGVQKIRADQVWGSYEGEGIVVAGIDTGVRYTHRALRNNWRRSYGWYDPYEQTRNPNDQNGHGTHITGTIAGTGGIGVAPKAQWIACKGCNSETCGGSQLYACGQWVQCPTLSNGRSKNCDMAPHVVSNSWGGSGGQGWYDDIIASWHASGIIPVFAIGNSGPECSTGGSPGDRAEVIAVGSTDSDDSISSFSSLGPAPDGLMKPDIAAPGGQVRSAWYTSDRAYNTISGTSMAAPHVSGVVALMLEKDPSLSYDDIYQAITQNAVTESLETSTAKTCDRKPASTFPNNVFGYGRIDAVNSVDAV